MIIGHRAKVVNIDSFRSLNHYDAGIHFFSSFSSEDKSINESKILIEVHLMTTDEKFSQKIPFNKCNQKKTQLRIAKLYCQCG